jgi:plastocyanin
MKKSIMLLVCVLLLVGIVACGRPGTPSQTNSSTGIVEVHTSNQTFVPSSVTIEKGQSLTLVNDSAVLHPIENGTWENGTAKPLQETGAPSVKVQLSGQDRQTIGPFTRAGTYQLFCTIHPGMNLTVVVP